MDWLLLIGLVVVTWRIERLLGAIRAIGATLAKHEATRSAVRQELVQTFSAGRDRIRQRLAEKQAKG